MNASATIDTIRENEDVEIYVEGFVERDEFRDQCFYVDVTLAMVDGQKTELTASEEKAAIQALIEDFDK